MSMRKIYREIAKKHGVSMAEVKRGMQTAIGAAYGNPNAAALAVPRKGNAPTPEEFILHMARRAAAESGKHYDHENGYHYQAKE